MAWRVRLLSRKCHAARGSGRSQAAVVASEGHGFVAPDEVHPSSSLGRRPGSVLEGPRLSTLTRLAWRKLNGTTSRTWSCTPASSYAWHDVERAAASVSFGRRPHVLHLVPQLFRGAPLVQAVIASDI